MRIIRNSGPRRTTPLQSRSLNAHGCFRRVPPAHTQLPDANASQATYTEGMSEQRRVGPAIAMITGIVASILLAALFPVYATGDWNRVEDPWEAAQTAIVTGGPPEPMVATRETITLLEERPDGTFFYAGETHGGGIVVGLVDAAGEGLRCSAAEDPSSEDPAEVACGASEIDDSGAEHFITLWAERAPAAASGYRHELRTFATEAEFAEYLGRWSAESLRH